MHHVRPLWPALLPCLIVPVAILASLALRADAATLDVSADTASGGSKITVKWSGIPNPSPKDWIALLNKPDPNSAHAFNYVYVDCTKVGTRALDHGQCDIPLTMGDGDEPYIPIPGGTVVRFRLMAAGRLDAGATLAESNDVVITPPETAGPYRQEWQADASGSADDVIPDARFDRYVQFTGSMPPGGGYNRGHVNYARVDGVVAPQEAAFFTAGFFRPNAPTHGALIGFKGDNDSEAQFMLTTSPPPPQAIGMLQWVGGEHEHNPQHGITGAGGPLIRSPAPHSSFDSGYEMDHWNFTAGVIRDACHRQVFTDGVWGGLSSQCKPWPRISYTTFGCVIFPGGESRHPYSGGLRDWAIVRGVPTSEELERMRNGESPMKIWGVRVWGYWLFTTDPSTGKKEPDLSGNGHDLTYLVANLTTTNPNGPLPQYVVNGEVVSPH